MPARGVESNNGSQVLGLDSQQRPDPVFEMVVLGCSGGPLETNCSGYLVKPANSKWEEGVIGLEGGSGLGALALHIERLSSDVLFPSVAFPEAYNTPVLKAAYIFSHLSCYLITHAHLDHALSLIMLSGSAPQRPLPHQGAEMGMSAKATKGFRIPVYAMRSTLDNLSAAYAGGLWPELGAWAVEPERGRSGRLRKRKTMDDPGEDSGVGAMFSPLSESSTYSQLHPSLPISNKVYPLLHGHTSHGCYHSSAVFLRYDPGMLTSQPTSRSASLSKVTTPVDGLDASFTSEDPPVPGREFLFFGDVESQYRGEGKEDFDVEGGKVAGQLNIAIWKHAADSFSAGRLAGIFIECSYDSSRPAELMFGHVSPPGVMHELQTLVSLLPSAPKHRPLEGLRVFITHIKELLVPHSTGLTARELIAAELAELEARNNLGVEFIIPTPGDRILI